VAADCGADNGSLIAHYRAAAPLLADECERLRLDNARLDGSILAELENRDNNAEWADKLAYAIADVETIGEHTNLNNPWSNALDAAENLHAECSRLQERVRVLEGSDLRARVTELAATWGPPTHDRGACPSVAAGVGQCFRCAVGAALDESAGREQAERSRDEWRAKWEQLETTRAVCCDQMERERDALRSRLAACEKVVEAARLIRGYAHPPDPKTNAITAELRAHMASVVPHLTHLIEERLDPALRALDAAQAKDSDSPVGVAATADDSCPDCRCLKVGHHPMGCEGAGGNCGCRQRFPEVEMARAMAASRSFPATLADLDALEERIVERVARASRSVHDSGFGTFAHLADELRRKP
jgi:hypothetical protein